MKKRSVSGTSITPFEPMIFTQKAQELIIKADKETSTCSKNINHKETIVANTEAPDIDIKNRLLAKIKELKRENIELKKMYADISMENRAIKKLIEYLQNSSESSFYCSTMS